MQVSQIIHTTEYIQKLYKIQHKATGIHNILYIFIFFCRIEYRYITHEIHGSMLYIQSYVIIENMIIEKSKTIKETFCNVILDFFSLCQNMIFLISANTIIEHQLKAHNRKNQIASEIILMVLNINIFFLVFT